MTACTRLAARRALFASLLLVPALTACRDSGGDDPGNPDAPPGTTPDAPSGMTPDARPGDTTPDGLPPTNAEDTPIFEIQGNLAEDIEFAVRGVVVVAIDNYGMRKGNFWIQEPEGGPRSGVMVFGAPLAEVAKIAVGDLVDVEGVVKDEFAYTGSGDFGDPVTELKPVAGGVITIVKKSAGTVPTPPVIDPIATSRDNGWEQWEGVLVRVNNADGIGSVRAIGDDDPTYKQFRIRGPVSVESAQVELPATAGSDACWTSVTGVVDYFYDFKIVPRSAADIDTTAGSCTVAEEATAETCGDSADNDGDSFVDCLDFSCQQAVVACAPASSASTVVAIQNGDVAVGTVVTLNDVFIIARSANNKNLWVADSLTAAPRNGVFIFRSENAVLGDEFAIGATVDVTTGKVKEFDVDPADGDTLTELEQAAVTLVAAPTTAPVPLTTASAEALASLATGEQYEGVLVQLTNLKITAVAAGDRVTLSDATNQTIVMDDTAFDYATGSPSNPNADFAVGTCLASVTGVMNVELGNNIRTLNPRNAGDIVRVTCPTPPAP
jgi:hypothetical protein